MIATKSEKVLRIRWDGVEERDFSLDLKRIPFSINQQVSYGELWLSAICWLADRTKTRILFGD